MTRLSARAVIWITALLIPASLRAQASAPAGAPAEPELRVDVIVPHTAVQVGAGVQIPMGYYVRLGADVAAGPAASGSLSTQGASGRVDLLGRFLLDPFRQSPWGLSAGAGISTRFQAGQRGTPYLLVAIDVEGHRAANGWVPAFQLGLGGGTRFGVVLRRAPAGYR